MGKRPVKKEKPAKGVRANQKKAASKSSTKVENKSASAKQPTELLRGEKPLSFAFSDRVNYPRKGVEPEMKPLDWYVESMTNDEKLKKKTELVRRSYAVYAKSKSEKDKKKYSRDKVKHLSAFRTGTGFNNRPQGLITLDVENLEPHQKAALERDKESIVMSGTSVNGIDKFAVFRVRQPKDEKEFTAFAQALHKRFGIPSTDDQTSPDRLRFLVHQRKGELYVNADAKPLLVDKFGLDAVKTELLDNGKALSTYCTLRHSYTKETALAMLEEYPISKTSKTITLESLPTWCEKWEGQYKNDRWATEDEVDGIELLEFIEQNKHLSPHQIFLDMTRKEVRVTLTHVSQLLQALREEGSRLTYDEYLAKITPKDNGNDHVILAMRDVISGVNRILCTLGNYSLIAGPKKSRKTLLTAFFIMLLPAGTRVIIFDTEQGNQRARRREKMLRAYCPDKVISVYNLRGMGATERKNVIDAVTEKEKPTFIVIDGIRDLISDINNPAEANDLIYWLEKLTGKEGTPHVMTILHTNKADNNARGHLGTELENKSENVFNTRPLDKGTATEVTNPFARDEAMNAFAIRHDKEGFPEAFSIDRAGRAEHKTWRTLETLFKGEALTNGIRNKDLLAALMQSLERGKDTCNRMIKELVKNGWLTHEDRNAPYLLGTIPNDVKEAMNENGIGMSMKIGEFKSDYNEVARELVEGQKDKPRSLKMAG